MAWLSRVNFTASDVLSYTDLNNLGNDIRAWGGNVNGGGYTLSNVVLSASSGTMATVIGGTGTTSTLTLRSTSGVGTTGADIIFQTGNNGATEVMRLQNGGNVGIKTSSPLALLSVGSGSLSDSSLPIQINAASSSQVWFGINKGGGYGGLIGYSNASAFGSSLVIRNVTTTDPIVFVTNNTSECMRIDSSGNVGIGTSSLFSKFTVSTSGENFELNPGLASVWDGGVIEYFNRNSASTRPNFNILTQGAFKVYTGGSNERMRIDSSGNVGIGTASNAGNTLRYLDLQNTDTGSSAGAIIRLITSNSAGTGSNTVDLVRYKTGLFLINNNDSSGVIAFNNAGSECMRILSTGQVGIGTSSPATSAKLEIAGTTGALLVPRLTTTQRNALTAVNGMIIYNTTDNQMQGYINGAWAAM